jgi:hypothetical protein
MRVYRHESSTTTRTLWRHSGTLAQPTRLSPGDVDAPVGTSHTGSMTVHLPRVPIKLDPLIAEAKRRMRRRRLIILALLACGCLAVGLTFALGPQPRSPAPLVQQRTSPSQLIVPNHSIGPIRLGEPRRAVEKSFGPGKLRHGWVSYFGGHILVDYVYKVRLTKHVQAIRTSWSGYRTRSGIGAGSNLQDVRRRLPGGACGGPNEACDLGRPGTPGTTFWMRRGKVAWIMLWFVS